MKKNDVGYIGSQRGYHTTGQRLYDALGGKVFQIRTGARLFLSSGGRDLSFRFPYWAGNSGANHCRIVSEAGVSLADGLKIEQMLFQVQFRHVGANRTTITHVCPGIPLHRLRVIYEIVTGL